VTDHAELVELELAAGVDVRDERRVVHARVVTDAHLPTTRQYTPVVSQCPCCSICCTRAWVWRDNSGRIITKAMAVHCVGWARAVWQRSQSAQSLVPILITHYVRSRPVISG
jgi:hypothetical protein